MNEKGFAATGILYTILVLFILLLLSIITMLYSRNNILNAIRNDVKGGIYNVVLNIKGEEITQRIENNTVEFNITVDHISDVTNIVCNNGSSAVYDEDNKTVTITNLKSGTVCKMNDSLKTTVDNLDYTKNNILMISDETLTSEITFAENTDAELNLNSHQLTLAGNRFKTYGDLIVNGDDNSIMTSTIQSLTNSGTGTLTINGGNYIRTTGVTTTHTVIYNEGVGKIEINGGNFENQTTTGPCVQNRLSTATDGGGTIEINGGTFTSAGATITNNSISGVTNINDGTINSSSSYAVANYNSGTVNVYDGSLTSANAAIFNQENGNFYIYGGTLTSTSSYAIYNVALGNIYIEQTTKPIYITTLAQSEAPAIKNGNVDKAAGVISISGNKANACTNNAASTTTGLCVYAEGDKNYTTNTANYAVSNHGNGTININGGTYFGGYAGISNHFAGTVNIKNANIMAGKLAISNLRIGPINICNSNISWFSNTVANAHYDLWINPNTATTATINYSSNVKFTDGTNTPSKGGLTANMIANYTGTCTG